MPTQGRRQHLVAADLQACAGLGHRLPRPFDVPAVSQSGASHVLSSSTHLQPVGDITIDLLDESHAVIEDVDGLLRGQRSLAQQSAGPW